MPTQHTVGTKPAIHAHNEAGPILDRLIVSSGSEEYILKRPLDLVFSVVGVILTLPLWIIIGLLIWLEDRGPVFYTSNRVGKNGKRFANLKFRTMIPHSDREHGPIQAHKDDKRITRVGKLLRSTAMDELPQLLNIVMGEMSFVGPRPLLPVELEVSDSRIVDAQPIESVEGYIKRHSVTPGLTGIAQIFAPRDIIRRRKFHYDLLYIKSQNLGLDLRLLVISFWITVRGKWDVRGEKA